MKDVEAAAREAGILSGLYAVVFEQPLSVNRFNKVKGEVVEQLLHYIKLTQHQEECDGIQITVHGTPVCYISKARGSLTGVYEVFTDVEWCDSPEVVDRVCSLLQEAVLEKRKRFEKKQEPAPKILLILNTYGFATKEIYKKCVGRVRALDYFHSVFIVWSDGTGFLLHPLDQP